MSAEYFNKPELDGFENKILSYQEAIIKIEEERKKGLKIILVQGVFDIVHVGHLEYLRKTKLACDLLFVGLENDLSVRLNKGESRPFNNLDIRLEFISQLQTVDFAFGFDDSPMYYGHDSTDKYIRRHMELKPNAIAVTAWDPNINLKEIQSDKSGVELVYIDTARRDSTTRLIRAIGYE